jgi:hypothetical protein
MLKKRMIPFGVEGGTRSRAAERMTTYSTRQTIYSIVRKEWKKIDTIVDEAEEEERDA